MDISGTATVAEIYERSATGTPPLLQSQDLPGPLSLNRLAQMGMVRKLDELCGYPSEYADTLYGRASIIGKIAPYGTCACSATALWIWLGGDDFPRTIDVLSRSHFRTIMHGRRIRTFSRRTSDRQIITIAGQKLTTPIRTACDLALLPINEMSPTRVLDTVATLMSRFGIEPEDCLKLLDDLRFLQRAPQARALFRRLKQADPGEWRVPVDPDDSEAPDETAAGPDADDSGRPRLAVPVGASGGLR